MGGRAPSHEIGAVFDHGGGAVGAASACDTTIARAGTTTVDTAASARGLVLRVSTTVSPVVLVSCCCAAAPRVAAGCSCRAAAALPLPLRLVRAERRSLLASMVLFVVVEEQHHARDRRAADGAPALLAPRVREEPPVAVVTTRACSSCTTLSCGHQERERSLHLTRRRAIARPDLAAHCAHTHACAHGESTASRLRSKQTQHSSDESCRTSTGPCAAPCVPCAGRTACRPVPGPCGCPPPSATAGTAPILATSSRPPA